MNTNNGILILSFLLILASSRSFGQYPLATGSPEGIFIFLDNRTPADGRIEILRAKDASGNYSTIGIATAPVDLEELKDRIGFYESFFPDLGKYTQQDIERMWNYLQRSSLIDTLSPVNYPVMHLTAGTAFLDSLARSGERYRYKINYYGNQGIKDTKTTDVVSYPARTHLPTPVFHDRYGSNNRIYLDWYVKKDPLLFSFRVYRRQNMAGEFERLDAIRGFYNRGDSLFLVMQDTSVNARYVYEYYVETLDRLNNPGSVSKPAIASSFNENDIPLIRQFEIERGEEDHSVVLRWEFDNPESVRSISVMRSASYDSGYVKVAEVSPADTTYTDIIPVAMENYYYYLIPEGIMERGYPSAIVSGQGVNRTIPSSPSEVGAEAVPGGIRLYWTHLDPLIDGYYVFRDNGMNDSLQQVSGLVIPEDELVSYLDTSSMNGGNTYRYAIRSVNDSYLLSELSDTVSASPLLEVPATPPSNLRGGYAGNKVFLVWDDMNLADQHLAGYNVYRKHPDGNEFELINSGMLLYNENIFTDDNIDGGVTYTYAVTSINESGNESTRSRTVSITISRSDMQTDPPSGFRVSRSGNSILLSWFEMPVNDIEAFLVYRYLPGESPEVIATIPPGTYTYEDRTGQPGQLYFYYMKTRAKDGKESQPSKTYSIKL